MLMNCLLDGKRILITGGTGSLGKVLLRRLLSGRDGKPDKVIILSRDEAQAARNPHRLPAQAPSDR